MTPSRLFRIAVQFTDVTEASYIDRAIAQLCNVISGRHAVTITDAEAAMLWAAGGWCRMTAATLREKGFQQEAAALIARAESLEAAERHWQANARVRYNMTV